MADAKISALTEKTTPSASDLLAIVDTDGGYETKKIQWQNLANGRGAESVVAPDDGITRSKAQADYVCDGTNDQSEITTAASASGRGIVQLTAGIFNIGAAMTINTGSLIRGVGSSEYRHGTKLQIGGNYTITIQPNSSTGVWSKLHDVLVRTPSGFNTKAIWLYGTKYGSHIIHPLANVNVVAYNAAFHEYTAPDVTAGSSGIFISTVPGGCLACSPIGAIAVSGFESGVHVYMGNEASNTYINGNFFEFIGVAYSKYCVRLQNVATGGVLLEIAMNCFSNISVQPNYYGTTVDGILIQAPSSANANIANNMFKNIVMWDWSSATGHSINITNQGTAGRAVYNLFEGKYNLNDAKGVTDDFSGSYNPGYKRYWTTSAWTVVGYKRNFFEQVYKS